jgi:hypothetical protein
MVVALFPVRVNIISLHQDLCTDCGYTQPQIECVHESLSPDIMWPERQAQVEHYHQFLIRRIITACCLLKLLVVVNVDRVARVTDRGSNACLLCETLPNNRLSLGTGYLSTLLFYSTSEVKTDDWDIKWSHVWRVHIDHCYGCCSDVIFIEVL